MTSAPAKAPPKEWPPNGIGTEPFTLDDVRFVPRTGGVMETAFRADQYIGDVLKDLVPRKDAPETIDTFWFARKVDSDWKEMRCVHEARAFIVSRIRQ